MTITLCVTQAWSQGDVFPVVQWGSYYSEKLLDNLSEVARYPDGGFVTVGTTSPTGQAGATVPMITRFRADGTKEWVRIMDGTCEFVTGIVVDKVGDIYICGTTSATTGIATSDAHQPSNAGRMDGFVAKIDARGQVVWSTYFGGSDGDVLHGLAFTDRGDLIAVGGTRSSGLATTGAYQERFGGLQDGLITQWSTAGVLISCTYFGGPSDDIATAVVVDGRSIIYVTGSTLSTTGIATSGAAQETRSGSGDMFLVSFFSLGAVQWSTYVGGDGTESARDLTYADGHLYLCGSTNSATGIAFPGAFDETLGGSQDALLLCYADNGQKAWGTYLGGADSDDAFSVITSLDGVVVAGFTRSTADIASTGAHQEASGGETDAVIWSFSEFGERRWSTYYGGEDIELVGDIGEIMPEDYILVGITRSTNDIAFNAPVQLEISEPPAGFTMRLRVCEAPSPSINGADSVCLDGQDRQYSTPLIAGNTYRWQPPRTGIAVSPVDTNTVTIRWSTPGTDTLWVYETSAAGCMRATRRIIVIEANVDATVVSSTGSFTACDGESITLTVKDSTASYLWSTGETTRSITLRASDTVSVTVRRGSCSQIAKGIIVTFTDAVVVTVSTNTGDTVLCDTDALVLAADGTFSALEWSTGETDKQITVTAPGRYFAKATNGVCTAISDTITVVRRDRPQPSITGPAVVCVADPESSAFSVTAAIGDIVRWDSPRLGTPLSSLDESQLLVQWTSAGTDTIRVTVSAGAGCDGTTTHVVTVLDTVACREARVIDVSDVDFGALPVDSLINANGGHVSEVIVVNISSSDISLDSASVTSAFSIPEQFPRLLRPGDTSRITIRFRPTDVVSYTGIISMYTSAITATATARGTGRALAADERVTEVLLQPDRLEVAPGDTFTVILALGEERPTPTTSTQYEATMQWDGRVLELISTPEVFFRTSGREDNYFTAKVPEGERQADQRELIRIPFRAKLADVDSTVIVFSGATAFRWKDDTKAFPSCRDSVIAVRICREGGERFITKRALATIIAVTPHPVSAETQITINTTAPANLSIDVIDPLGGVVRRQALGRVATGETIVPLDLSSLPPGPYVIRVLDGWRGDARTILRQ
jgi:hypothetical protein